MKPTTTLLFFVFGARVVRDVVAARSQADNSTDPGWPRQVANEQGRLVYYQPQVDDWKNFKELDFRAAFALTPKGQKEIIGVVVLQANSEVNIADRNVVLTNFKITDVRVPSLAPDQAAKVDQLVRSFLPPNHTVSISLERLVASVDKSQTPQTVQVQNDPPPIFVSYTPAILLQVDGEPTRADIAETNLGFVVNSNFPLFFEKDGNKLYYLYTGAQWLQSSSLEGPWTSVARLPKGMSNVAQDPKWDKMKKPILSPSATGKPPTVFYSTKPAEVILFKGQPAYANIPGTQLSYATNTDCDLFTYSPTKEYYYLVAGRWFKATDLKGPWTYATPELPPDFANIPEGSPAARVLVSVPGTGEAKDAVLMAQIPTTAIVDPKVAEQVKVSYNGEPQFKPIEGTSLQYAVNTADKVIKAGDVYCLCLQGIWFTSSTPQGPWTTASSVPQEVYQIPPSSPVYNVTYVKQSTNSEGKIEASYTAGYLGTFISGVAMGAILASGTGYYYPPYVYYAGYGYPYYHPYPVTYGWGSYYNPYTGAYGVAHGVYGPYYGAAAGAYYNPYTGTYARGATAYGPYGTRSAGQAYNPYTGTYAATSQGSNAYSSWGHSYVSQGNRSAYTQHYSSANVSEASIQGSQGGEAAGVSTKHGNTAAGKTASGDMYVDHDGNIYKNTGSGWEKYDNGNWNPVQHSDNVKNSSDANRTGGSSQTTSQQRGQSSERSASSGTGREKGQGSTAGSEGRYSRAGSSGASDVDREFQNRQRGASQSERFKNFQRSEGGRRSGLQHGQR
jgi:hypothetical protein